MNLENAIVVVDEAHNLETVAEDACSYKLDVKDLKFTIENT